MGGGRARAALAAGAVVAIGLAAGGCGESRHPNQQRPQVSTRVSVTITDGAVVVEPSKVATGPEKSQQIAQNQNHPQGEIRHSKAPLDVTFVVANQTGHPTAVKVRGAGHEVESASIGPRSPETFAAELPAGSYAVTATGVSGSAGSSRLEVGTYRASSQNDLLLP